MIKSRGFGAWQEYTRGEPEQHNRSRSGKLLLYLYVADVQDCTPVRIPRVSAFDGKLAVVTEVRLLLERHLPSVEERGPAVFELQQEK